MKEYERPLAYIVTVDETKRIENYDRVKLARTNGWWCIVGINELNEGDKAVYFEIDSEVPSDDERFKFLEKRKYKIKPMRMCGVISQGLLMPIDVFPELKKCEVGEDVTKKLGVIYSEPEDRIRKEPTSRLQEGSIKSKHKKFFSNRFVKKMMRFKVFRRSVMAILKWIHRNDLKMEKFPTKFKYVNKTDENRIENLPMYLGYKKPFVVTEKLDGSSVTYILERKSETKYEFYVCSRNIRVPKDNSIYWEMAEKYDIETKLRFWFYVVPNLEYVCLQGECVGNVQGNPLRLEENDLYIFNYIRSDKGRYSSVDGARLVDAMGMKWVPIIDTEYYVPENLEEFKDYASGASVINPGVLREGLVLRNYEDNISFKNVSIEYLLSKR